MSSVSLERLWNNLQRRWVMLAAVVLVFAAFLALGSLDLVQVLTGLGVIVVVAAAAPERSELRPAHDNQAGEPLSTASVSFADALPEPCLILDRRTVVLHRNAAAARQFEGVPEGRPLSFALRNPPLLAAVEAVRQGGAPQTVELHQTVPTETWHRVSLAALGDDGLMVVTLHNLTDEKRLDAMRADFIANASHELRTPLASLLGFIDTLLGPAAGDAVAREKFLAIMRSQALRMSKLIEDLLSLSRIEMRQHLRPTARLDLASLLREVREGLQTQAAEAGVVVNLDLPAAEAAVTGDRDELHEVFENLLDNAIKYGADGGRIDVVLEADGDRRTVTITDYGVGIEPEHVPRLTERFYRVDADSSRRKKGTGLGLAIVKHIVTRHRGSLAIKSRPGEGTQVAVQLPQ